MNKRLVAELHAKIQQRRAAVERWKKNPRAATELVVVVCRTCRRPIATTKVDQDKGEPPILLELADEHEPERWECFECAACPACGYIVGCRCADNMEVAS